MNFNRKSKKPRVREHYILAQNKCIAEHKLIKLTKEKQQNKTALYMLHNFNGVFMSSNISVK